MDALEFILPVASLGSNRYQSFQLSNEPFQEPIERVQIERAREPERLGWKR